MTIYDRFNTDTTAFVIFLLWLGSMLFLEKHILIELFFYIVSIGMAIGLLQSMSNGLEDYYCEKRSKRELLIKNQEWSKRYLEMSNPQKD